jgi:CubicO group peptidase (beta-lactamase class C family)
MRETYTRVSGLDARRIAKPHNITASGQYQTLKFEKTDATMNSAGGHLATLNDLARWVIVQMDSGRIDGRQVFPREAVALSHRLIARQTRDQAKRFAFFDREGWAAGWDIGSYMGERMVSRFGSYSSTRSHLSMLPGRRVGVVAQANGPIASSATDIVAAFVYDLEAGRPNARDIAAQRLTQLAGRLPEARRSIAQHDSVRRERQKPLERPLRNFVGSYYNRQFGRLEFYQANGALRYRWGVLEGPAEVYDARRNQLRIEVVGDGKPAAFDFDRGQAAAQSVTLGDIRFVRMRR